MPGFHDDPKWDPKWERGIFFGIPPEPLGVEYRGRVAELRAGTLAEAASAATSPTPAERKILAKGRARRKRLRAKRIASQERKK